MEVPPEITYRGIEKTDEIEALIREKAAKLDRIHPGIISCRVAVEREQEHQRSGSPYRVRVAMRIPPGKELVGRIEPGDGEISDRLQTLVAEAFEAVRRQLIKVKDLQQGKVKAPPEQEQIGHVVRLFSGEGYGFIRSTEGREIYFHRNAVLNDDFERLDIGTGVRFFPSGGGGQGPQASTVQIVDKPGGGAAEQNDRQVEPPKGWKA
jgi:cold shock CspA family protein/ribosome-associated translation inhibitor RaiA